METDCLLDRRRVRSFNVRLLWKIAMRILLLLLVLLGAPAAQAFTAEQMTREFDARWLTDQEKRLLQTGLAFAGSYNGMIDGAWGAGSQRALERYTLAQGGSAIVTNGDAVLAALEAYSALEAEGWERQYNSRLDMSFLVPTKALVEGGWSDVFFNMEVRGRSIGYSLTVQDAGGTATAPVHRGQVGRRGLYRATGAGLDHLGKECGRRQSLHPVGFPPRRVVHDHAVGPRRGRGGLCRNHWKHRAGL